MSTEPKSTARRDKTDEWDFRKPVSTEPKLGTCDYNYDGGCGKDSPHVEHHGLCVNWREGESAATRPGCDKCGHLIGYHAAGNPEGKCTICGCDNYYKDGKPTYESVPPAAETAMTAEQFHHKTHQIIKLPNCHCGKCPTPTESLTSAYRFAEAYVAHVREAAQGDYQALHEKYIAAVLELSKLRVKPIVDKEKQGEY